MKRKIIVILFAIVFIAGLGLMLYPTFSSWWNRNHQSQAVVDYQEAIEAMTPEQRNKLLTAAEEYNRKLYALFRGSDISEEELRTEYDSLLDVYGDGMMGILTIPSISVRLPVKHGTGEPVLQDSIGHVDNSSLPVGGANTHAVFSGHTGLPSARLFTDLEQVRLGDTFTLEVLGRVMTYEVDQILVVLPWQAEALAIEPNQDYCTLITCTPYSVNSHRLLVRGRRTDDEVDWKTEDEKKQERETRVLTDELSRGEDPSKLLKDEKLPIYIAVGAVIALILGLVISKIVRTVKKRKSNKEETTDKDA